MLEPLRSVFAIVSCASVAMAAVAGELTCEQAPGYLLFRRNCVAPIEIDLKARLAAYFSAGRKVI